MASIFTFIAAFGKQKAEQSGRTIAELFAAVDPETMTEAEVSVIEQEVDKLVQRVAQLRTGHGKEQREAVAAQEKYDQLLAVAERLDSEAKKATGAKKTSLENSLASLVSQIEEFAPELERENQEAEDAKQILDEYEKAAEAGVQKLKNLRRDLGRARQNMEQAALKKQRAEERSAQATALAGIRTENSSLGVALDAMNRKAQKDLETADAHDYKAKLLSKSTELEGDPNIARAMAAVKGAEAPKLSTSERLKALKNKSVPVAA